MGMRDEKVARVETPSGATTETNGAAPGAAPSNPGAESPPAAKGPGENERIDELTRNWRETQGDRDFWKNRALANEGKAPANADAEREAANGGADDDDDIKTLADFKYDEKAYGKYIRGLANEAAERAANKVRGEIKGERTAAERTAAVSDFQERATSWAAGQKLEKVELMFASPAAGGPSVSGEMAEAIMTSDHGPEILNYLTRNAAESKRIHKLSPIQQAREIGRLEAKFASTPTPPTVSGAPPPHETVKGASDTGIKADPAKQTDAEWWASKQRSERAKAAARK